MIICISWFVREQSDILFMEEAACTSIACGAYLAHIWRTKNYVAVYWLCCWLHRCIAHIRLHECEVPEL